MTGTTEDDMASTYPSQPKDCDEDLGQEQEDFAPPTNLDEPEGCNGVQVLGQELMADEKDKSGQTRKSETLEGLEILAGKPVSIIAGANDILPDLRSYKPSITFASQVVGLYFFSERSESAFLEILKLKSKNSKLEEDAKSAMFRDIQKWCLVKKNCATFYKNN